MGPELRAQDRLDNREGRSHNAVITPCLQISWGPGTPAHSQALAAVRLTAGPRQGAVVKETGVGASMQRLGSETQ
jgi:hypothetical protein